jgi:DNA gyrase subunit B/topoisomerase-4 subunit B
MSDYNASSIAVLEGREHVRRRPGMYIGSTGKDGLHHLVREIVDNSVDEAMNGHATRIDVELSPDGRTVTVSDNGRGIPVDIHPKVGKPALEVILCTLHSGGKFGDGGYKTSGGLHGVGSSVVNFLSEELVATIRRDGFEWRQSFRRGLPRGPLEQLRPFRGHGTIIRFTPDPEVFGEQLFDPDQIRSHLEVASFLHKGLRIRFIDLYGDKEEDFEHQGGVLDFLEHCNRAEAAIPVSDRPFVLERLKDPRIDIALHWTDAPRERLRCFVNGIPTPDGGTHENGLRDGIVKAVRNYVDTHEASLPRGLKPTAEDVREGITAICSIFLEEPQFQSQTKNRLNNPEVKPAVEGLVRMAVEGWLHANKSVADAVLARVVMSARARAASREAADQVRRKAAPTRRLNLPGKLADCSSGDPDQAELFIVEGDSAGGSAKQGRDRATQAVLPLRGKVLNAEQANLKKVLSNSELSDIVSALGCGIDKDFDLSRLRYHKVILLMDADSDGHHIATLLLAFFFRHLRPLIDAGHIYLASPPLFRIDAGKQTWWAADEAERDRILKRLSPRQEPEISRFKGLGEMMPRTLFDTTLNPATRRLLKVGIPEGTRLETEQVMGDLLGKDPQTRFREITEWMALVEDVDI